MKDKITSAIIALSFIAIVGYGVYNLSEYLQASLAQNIAHVFVSLDR